ncbi:hypothetical protein BpHYR1_054537 [Brachionus plicatilis]|uniref:Uncharacterized protein n=1 Tax=Brachionus plicatilis TaxID=10195 RepID=A0A3M7RF78_BRAPC|nr:hypothetical protein BpHYR1_054537 [Brachionus plicatilis]
MKKELITIVNFFKRLITIAFLASIFIILGTTYDYFNYFNFIFDYLIVLHFVLFFCAELHKTRRPFCNRNRKTNKTPIQIADVITVARFVCGIFKIISYQIFLKKHSFNIKNFKIKKKSLLVFEKLLIKNPFIMGSLKNDVMNPRLKKNITI